LAGIHLHLNSSNSISTVPLLAEQCTGESRSGNRPHSKRSIFPTERGNSLRLPVGSRLAFCENLRR
jgi:hypothetical protein